jgi:hypothetical protein
MISVEFINILVLMKVSCRVYDGTIPVVRIIVFFCLKSRLHIAMLQISY